MLLLILSSDDNTQYSCFPIFIIQTVKPKLIFLQQKTVKY